MSKQSTIFVSLLVLVLIWPVVAGATPSISSTSGTMSDGNSITISGSGFGTKTTAAPLIWDNFESGSISGDWSLHDVNVVSTSQRTNSSYCMQTKSGSAYRLIKSLSGNSSLGYFQSAWFYIPADFEWTASTYQIKLFRVTGSDDSIKPNFIWGMSAQGGDHTYATGNMACTFESGYATGTTMTKYITDGTGNMPRGQWNLIEMFMKRSSGVGNNDGIWNIWINGKSLQRITDATSDRTYSNNFDNDMRSPCTVSACTTQPRYDDIYYDLTPARVYISTASTWSSKQTSGAHCELLIPTSWSSTSIGCTFNQGSFATNDTAYIYVVASDESVNANGYQITIGSGGGNHAPVANADSYTTYRNTAKVQAAAGVLTNDTDADGDTLTAIKVTDPGHGTVSLSSNGGFTYTPTAGWTGTDSFTYKCNDGTVDSSNATVTIVVSNRAPTATADSYTTTVGTAKVQAAPGVLSNDTDPDSDTLTAVKVTDPSHGTVSLSSNGGFTYTPTAGYSGTDSFTYKANDGLADSSTVAVTITVGDTVTATSSYQNFGFTSQNGRFAAECDQVPGAAGIDGVTALSYGTVSTWSNMACMVRFNTSNTIDARNGGSYTADNTISYSASTNYHFRMTPSVTNHTYSIYVTPNGSGEQTLGSGYAFRTEQQGVSSLNNWCVICDVGSGFTSSNRTINVSPTASNDSYSVTEDQVLTQAAAGVLSNDSDPESNTLTAIKVTDPSHGTVSLASNGGFTYTPTVGFCGTDAFTYKANDGHSDSAAATVNITINGYSVTSTGSYQNYSFASKNGTFNVTYDAVPHALGYDYVTSLSSGIVDAWGDMACAVRFNPTNTIDARKAGTYTADNTISYSAGTSYHFRLVVNVTNHTYSIYVTPNGGSEQTVGSGFGFRTEQVGVSSLDNWCIVADAGDYHNVSNFCAQ